MRVAGTREDGALWLTLDGGMSVILCEDRCSPPMDPQVAERLGPWRDAHGVSGGDRRELARRLDKARTFPVSTFALDMRKVKVSTVHGKKKLKFEYETDDGQAIGVEPDEAVPVEDSPAVPAEDADSPDKEAATEDEDKEKVVALDKDEHGYGSYPKGDGGRSEGDLAREASRHAAEDRRAAMAKTKAAREEGWTAGGTEGRNTKSVK